MTLTFLSMPYLPRDHSTLSLFGQVACCVWSPHFSHFENQPRRQTATFFSEECFGVKTQI